MVIFSIYIAPDLVSSCLIHPYCWKWKKVGYAFYLLAFSWSIYAKKTPEVRLSTRENTLIHLVVDEPDKKHSEIFFSKSGKSQNLQNFFWTNLTYWHARIKIPTKKKSLKKSEQIFFRIIKDNIEWIVTLI